MSTSRTILLVEDEPTLQRILGSVLTDAGHTVESVGTAEAALTRLEDSGAPDVDLILSDKNLPAMNGLELLARVRESERRAGITRGFVLVTGYPSRESALTVLAEGGDGYLVKPFRSLVHAALEVRAVLDAPLEKKRHAARRAKQVANVLSGVPSALEPGLSAAFLLDDKDAVARGEARLREAGASVVPLAELEQASAPVLVAGRVEDLSTWRKKQPGAGLLLADGAVSFNDIVSLIALGGGAVYDPALVTV